MCWMIFLPARAHQSHAPTADKATQNVLRSRGVQRDAEHDFRLVKLMKKGRVDCSAYGVYGMSCCVYHVCNATLGKAWHCCRGSVRSVGRRIATSGQLSQRVYLHTKMLVLRLHVKTYTPTFTGDTPTHRHCAHVRTDRSSRGGRAYVSNV